MRYGTVITLFHGYSHDIIMNAIDSAKEWAAEHSNEGVTFLLRRRPLRRARRGQRGGGGLLLDDARSW